MSVRSRWGILLITEEMHATTPWLIKNRDEVNKQWKSLCTTGYKSFLAAYRASAALDKMWHTASFCPAWQVAQEVTVCSVISWKRETQLVCQVAAYSYYNNRTEIPFHVIQWRNQSSITLEFRERERDQEITSSKWCFCVLCKRCSWMHQVEYIIIEILSWWQNINRGIYPDGSSLVAIHRPHFLKLPLIS